MGHKSRVILPGPGFPEDLPEVMRVAEEDLKSADWWKRLGLDGLIMVAWGRHQDTPISKAIASSGTPFALHIDGSCNHYPLLSRVEGLKTFWRAERDVHRGPAKILSFLKYAIGSGLSATTKHSYLKYRHLRCASVVTCQTPISLRRNTQLCRLFGGRSHGVNLKLVGYPIAPECIWDPEIRKQRRIIAVGRWEDLRQKRPRVLMAVSKLLAEQRVDVAIDIFGTKTSSLQEWHNQLKRAVRDRIILHGQKPGAMIAQAMSAAQITLFTSAYEGGPQALFEGLSCGATTVALRSPFLPASAWAEEVGHGDLAAHDTPEDFVSAIEKGLGKWERGLYKPSEISKHWQTHTRLEEVLNRMITAALDSKRTQTSNQLSEVL